MKNDMPRPFQLLMNFDPSAIIGVELFNGLSLHDAIRTSGKQQQGTIHDLGITDHPARGIEAVGIRRQAEEDSDGRPAGG